MDDFENKDRGFDGAEQEGGTTRIDMPRRHRREEAPEDAPEREAVVFGYAYPYVSPSVLAGAGKAGRGGPDRVRHK